MGQLGSGTVGRRRSYCAMGAGFNITQLTSNYSQQRLRTQLNNRNNSQDTVKMNAEKLKQLQANVRIGGKGTVRRKKKVVHRTATTDDKKLQSSLKKLSDNNIPGIEEVNMIKDDGTVIHFNNPKVQASLQSNTFAVTGHAENKQITEMLPGILNQLGAESLTHLKKLASNVGGAAGLDAAPEAGEDDDDEVPDLVENFDEASKDEKATEDVKISEETPAEPAATEE